MVRSSVSIVLLAVGGAAQAQAGDAMPIDAPGWHVGGAIGARSYHDACGPQALSCDRSGSAWGAFAGYRFEQRIGIELGYVDLGNARASYPRLTSPLQVKGDIAGYDISILYGIPIAQDSQVFLRAGAYRWRAQTHSTEFSMRDDGWSATAGGGFEWRMAPSWRLRGQYLYVNDVGGQATGGGDAHVLSLGLVYTLPVRP